MAEQANSAEHRRNGGLCAAGLRFMRRHPRALASLGGWSMLEAAQTFLLGYAIARALDDGFLQHRPAVGLAWLGAAALGILAGALGSGRVYRAVAALAEPLRDLLVQRVVGRGLRDAVLRGRAGESGEISRLTHQVEIGRDSFAGLVMSTRSFVFTAVGALVGLFSLHPLLLVIVLPPLAGGLLIFGLTLRPLARRQRVFLEADEQLAETLGATVAGLRDTVACGAEERIRRDALARVETERRAAGALARWSVARAVALSVGGQLPILLLLVMGPWLLARGVSAGALAGAFTYLVQALLPALQSLIQGLGGAGARLAVVIGRLRDGGGQDGPPPAAHQLPAPQDPGAALELDGVTFAYGERAEPVLAGLRLSLPMDASLAVVGPSGIGKSTLAGLIAGLLRPTGGVVRRRGEVALIPQEAYVFSGTVRDNLSYLCPGPVPDETAGAAVEQTGAGELTARLGGLDGMIDPAALSAGERQLIALARAYLSPARVVVLDEATCHLDPAAEARAERAFLRRPGALIVIAHRISSARRADRVLVLDGAHPVCGRHAELLACSALYRDLAGSWGGWRPAGSEPARALSDADGVNAVTGPGLAGDRGHIVPYGPVAQMKGSGDLGDRGSFGGEGQNA
ncbi:ATP-binding cassette domain-containing protein [Streptomyces gobiensis]|uniref:ATP-binding cassette domain-containing protein n=1 Tax=Streptomyces gobiensis TaxID=2875706 RepID=UPI001E49ECFD|nr:ABC transporter ATP-binding protein [Streptomyces gobiensis]UGY91132.1 ABC transporter ATP-binding protein/permease [Streptomyces gobiensis]